MSIPRRHFIASGAAAAVSLAVPFERALAQQQPPPPIETVRIIQGFPAGSTPDVLARKVGEHLTRGYAQAVVVDNRLGAGGQLAVTTVKAAAPDGATILLSPMAVLGVFPYTYKSLPYDPVADLVPVTKGVTYDYGIGVGPAVPRSVKNIRDLLAWYKANPGQANMGSPSTGSTLHFTIVMLGRAAGVEVTHVGYKGSAPALLDLIGGTLPAHCAPLGTFLNEPRLRVVATSGASRSRFTPDVPTLVEQGFKDMNYDEWYGFFLPARSSAAVVARLNAALTAALKQKDVIDTLATFGMEAAPGSPEQLGAALKADMARWGPIVKSVGFSADS
jgi:tripartite-type tricarboxylate transporter receptor subunit TctC